LKDVKASIGVIRSDTLPISIKTRVQNKYCYDRWNKKRDGPGPQRAYKEAHLTLSIWHDNTDGKEAMVDAALRRSQFLLRLARMSKHAIHCIAKV